MTHLPRKGVQAAFMWGWELGLDAGDPARGGAAPRFLQTRSWMMYGLANRARSASFPISSETLLLGGIIAAAAVIRFATLGHQSYDHDEAVTAWRVLRGGLGAALHAVVQSERSPPLYYLLAWAWAQLFGTAEVGLRSLSARAGVLTVPAAYLT